jgi:hypothetical protein
VEAELHTNLLLHLKEVQIPHFTLQSHMVAVAVATAMKQVIRAVQAEEQG